VLLLERDSLVPEEILARLEASIQPRPAYFDERVRLVEPIFAEHVQILGKVVGVFRSL